VVHADGSACDSLRFGDSGKPQRPAKRIHHYALSARPQDMIQTLRSAIAEIDPLLALQDVQPVTDAVSAIEAPRHFNTDLITVFATVALCWRSLGFMRSWPSPCSAHAGDCDSYHSGRAACRHAKLVLVSGAKLALLGCALGFSVLWPSRG